MAEVIFWISVAFCFYTYFGYPVLIRICALLFERKVEKGCIEPEVSFIITGHNEEKVIENKIINTLALDYPKEKIKIIVASDGSTDRTVDIAERFCSKEVAVIQCPRRGKVSAINDAVRQAAGDIIIFSDCRQRFDKGSIRSLVENFNDLSVGAVSGELIIDKGGAGFGSSMVTYWNYEKSVRKNESVCDSVIGATGAIWAIRKNLFEPYPQDILVEDLYQPMRTVLKGYRVIFEPLARAYDTASQRPEQEIKRKIRTIAGNWQIFLAMPELFNPLRNRALLQFVSHKVFRVLIPIFLAAAFFSNLLLLGNAPYRAFFFIQAVFYFMCCLSVIVGRGHILPGFFRGLHAFAVLNYSSVAGFINFVLRRQGVLWKN